MTTVTLDSEAELLVRRLVDSGRYSSAGEAVTAALRLLEDPEIVQRQKLNDLLSDALTEADAGQLFSADEVFAEVRRELGLKRQSHS